MRIRWYYVPILHNGERILYKVKSNSRINASKDLIKWFARPIEVKWIKRIPFPDEI